MSFATELAQVGLHASQVSGGFVFVEIEKDHLRIRATTGRGAKMHVERHSAEMIVKYADMEGQRFVPFVQWSIDEALRRANKSYDRAMSMRMRDQIRSTF